MNSSFLTEKGIRKMIAKEELIVEPLKWKDQITAAGIDLRLDTIFREFVTTDLDVLDVSKQLPETKLYQLKELKVERKDTPKNGFRESGGSNLGPSTERDYEGLQIGPMVVHRGEFIMGQTLEYVCLSKHLLGFLDGRSSLARRGIVVHATAGSIEPGFRGHVTLELGNIGKMPVKIFPLMRIACLHLAPVAGDAVYSGQFWGQVRVKPPKPDRDLLWLLGEFRESAQRDLGGSRKPDTVAN